MWKDTVVVGLWGGCWSLSQHPACTRRRQGISLVKSSVHPSVLSEQIGVVPGSKGTSAVLWRCSGTSYVTSTISNVCPQPGLEPKTFFSAPQDCSTCPHRSSYFWVLKSNLPGWNSICSPLLWHTSVHEVGVVSNLISFSTWSRGVAAWLPEIGLPLPIIVNIIPPERHTGRREATRGGACLLEHPLKPKLLLIYMFRL